jgi:hypothetical protein
MSARGRTFYCDFCGRPEHATHGLYAKCNVHICDACVRDASDKLGLYADFPAALDGVSRERRQLDGLREATAALAARPVTGGQA